MKYCCHIGLSRPNCSSIACCWSAFRFSLMKAASGVPGISRNMKNRMVVTASRASALCAKRSRTSRMSWLFRGQRFVLAGRIVELVADHAVAGVLQDLLGLCDAGLHRVDGRVVPEAQDRRDMRIGGDRIVLPGRGDHQTAVDRERQGAPERHIVERRAAVVEGDIFKAD